ncbi:MAG: signal peptide peptidase SppA [Nanoarchaeota archaeon]|nr:signal peptide peptidase SppA [Nanoarchaeota archaeon]
MVKLTNNKDIPKRKFNILTAIKIVFMLFIISWLLSAIISSFVNEESFGNTALIPISGLILTRSNNLFSDTASSSVIVEKIKSASIDSNIKAIILEVNSVGGSAVASEEIVQALENTNKTIVAFIRDVGASGGYWVASTAKHIFASRMSIVGSIGVFSSYPEFSGLLNKYNVTYNRLVAGEYKDIGSPFVELDETAEKILQEKINSLHEYFLDEIVDNRNLSSEIRKEIATGLFYTGLEAKDLGLIDSFGSKENAIDFVEKELNITVKIKSYEDKQGFRELLLGFVNQKDFSFLSQELNLKNSYGIKT